MPRQPVPNRASPTNLVDDDGDVAAPQPAANKAQEQVAVLSHAPVEDEPEDAGTMTRAAATAITPTYEKGPAKGLVEGASKPEPPKPSFYRVLQDKQISSNGARTLLRAGKELDPRQYNINDLRKQGVRMQEFDSETGEDILPTAPAK